MTNPCVCKLVLSFILWATCDMADLNTAFQQTNSDEAHYHKFSLLRTWFYVILATSILCLKQRCILFTVFSFKLDKTLWILRSIQAHTDLRYLSNDRFHVDECRVFFCKIKSRFCRGSLLSSMIWCFVICSIWIRRKFTFTISRFRQSRCASVDCEWLDWRE